MDDGIQLTATANGGFAVSIDGSVRGFLRKAAGNAVLWTPCYGRFTLRLSWGEFCRLTRHR